MLKPAHKWHLEGFAGDHGHHDKYGDWRSTVQTTLGRWNSSGKMWPQQLRTGSDVCGITDVGWTKVKFQPNSTYSQQLFHNYETTDSSQASYRFVRLFCS